MDRKTSISNIAATDARRWYIIDYVKAIAIILVVMTHFEPYDQPVWWLSLRKVTYNFRMPVFMFAAGFLFNISFCNESRFSFLWKKFKRLIIPFVVVSLLVITIKLCIQEFVFVQYPISVSAYFSIFDRPATAIFLWFVWLLWWMFVIISAFRSKKWHVILFVLSIVLAYLPWRAPDEFYLSRAQIMFAYFMLGVMVYDYKDMISRLVSKSAISKGAYILGGMILYIILEIIMFTIPGASKWTNIMLPYIGIFVMLGLCWFIDKSNCVKLKSCLSSLAAYSFVIFLFHSTCMGIAKAFVQKLPVTIDTNGISYALLALFVIACGVFIPILLDKYVIIKSTVIKFLLGIPTNKTPKLTTKQSA